MEYYTITLTHNTPPNPRIHCVMQYTSAATVESCGLPSSSSLALYSPHNNTCNDILIRLHRRNLHDDAVGTVSRRDSPTARETFKRRRVMPELLFFFFPRDIEIETNQLTSARGWYTRLY